jgi:CRP-like cAMP-binding protein
MTLLPYASGGLTILPLFYGFVIVVHFFSSLLLGVANSAGLATSYLHKFAAMGFSFTQLYFCSVYFVMTTIFTIGFGDISPQTRTEIIITILLEIVGISLFSLIMSYLVSILIDPEENDYVHHYKVMQNYLRFWHIPEEHHRALREYCQYQWETTRGTGNVKRILQSLPVTIRNTMKLEMVRIFFEGARSFQGLSQIHLVYIADAMVLKTYSPGDLISEQGDEADRMYFFQSGLLSVIMDGKRVATQSCGEGLIMFEYEMLLGQVKASTLKAITYMEVWVYRLEDLVKLIARKTDIRLIILDKLEKEFRDRFPRVLERIVPDEALRQSVIEFNQARTGRTTSNFSGV